MAQADNIIILWKKEQTTGRFFGGFGLVLVAAMSMSTGASLLLVLVGI
jgi:hypothetical protein